MIATGSGAEWPSLSRTVWALIIGAFAYGLSLVLFVVGLRNLGAARTTAYFSTAPFVGALVSLVWLREPVTIQMALAAVGVWLHLTERHEHRHHHPELEHSHEHATPYH